MIRSEGQDGNLVLGPPKASHYLFLLRRATGIAVRLSLRSLDFLVQRPIVETRPEEFCRRWQHDSEIMHGANLYLTGANRIVQRVSSGLFILPQKVSMRALAILHQMATTGPAYPLC